MDIARTAATPMTTTDRLVAFDTASRRANRSLIGFVRAYPDPLGVTYHISSNRSGTKNTPHAPIGPRCDRVIRRLAGRLPL